MIFSEEPIEESTAEEITKRYTQALAQSMQNTKDVLMGEILSGNVEKHQIEVDFDE